MSTPPSDLSGHASRVPYGRNGRGRHAAFRFSDPYFVETTRDGVAVTYEVKRGSTQPFEFEQIKREQVDPSLHGTEIRASSVSPIVMTAHEAREAIGMRFLADPNFEVYLDGTRVTFDDIPSANLERKIVDVPGFGEAKIVIIDSFKSDKTTRQHGIAWRVNSRLVGSPSWIGFDHERILDGRTAEAKRFLFIVFADFLADAVSPDWTGFNVEAQSWTQAEPLIHEAIKATLSDATVERRKEAKDTVKNRHRDAVAKLTPVGRERWTLFVDRVVDSCPSISVDEVEQVAGILATLESSTTKYGVLGKLHEFEAEDFDALHSVLNDWSMRLAKDALDEIQSRLKLIEELNVKLRDKKMSEVGDIQPLIDKSLWVFGPEYESIEFTSNKGMTEVVRKFFDKDASGVSRLRPDYVVVPDGSVGLYSRDGYDENGEVNGVGRLVIAEIKKPGVDIGTEQKAQPWGYVRKLREKGFLLESTPVTCFVLGEHIEAEENEPVQHGKSVTVIPMTYNVFVRRAEARMLGLREKLKSAPFLQEYIETLEPDQTELALNDAAAAT